ncbi:MAG: hypothetical protein O7A04_10475 [Acidobacteria bacterium]|nr:hypothetical protein [Acidobacteriota bacterium]
MKHISRWFSFAAGLTFLLPAAPAFAEDERSLEDRCRAEVVELHEFLEQWSNAELPATEEAFARFGDVIAPAFLIIGPDGEQAGQESIVDAIRAAHGRWREAPGRIRIENYRLHHAAGGLALATYEEWHDLDEGLGRLSTVLFGPNDAAPNGVEWLHLHEVWIDPPEAGTD